MNVDLSFLFFQIHAKKTEDFLTNKTLSLAVVKGKLRNDVLPSLNDRTNLMS